MTLRDLTNQFCIQGAFCIKRWRDDWDDYAKFSEGSDFECDRWDLKEDCLDAEITYMYAVDGVLHIEIEWEDSKTYESIEDALVEKISNDSVENIERFLGYPIFADVLEELDDRIRAILDEMTEDELFYLEAIYLKESYTAFAYENEERWCYDSASFSNKEQAIKFAEDRNWDEVVDNHTSEVVWTRR